MLTVKRYPHVGMYLGLPDENPEQRWEVQPEPDHEYLANHKLTARTAGGYVLNYCMVPT